MTHVYAAHGGPDEGPVLLLLHGLGATAEVWRGAIALLDEPGGPAWLAPDLPGHGRSSWLTSYSFGDYAEALRPLVPADREVWVLGHSMGGMIGLELASRTPAVTRVAAFGVKVHWPPEDVAGAAKQATRTPKTYPTHAEAATRYLKLSGLVGLVEPDDPSVEAGLRDEKYGWQLAQDPATFGFGTPDIADLLARVDCPVRLARGEYDAMVTDAQLAAVVADAPGPVTLTGLGHNAQVEDPARVLDLLGAHFRKM
ncbi:alpha/beta fold hydrolase [Nocardioides speluncae]|uniref:alpha/beta fold hydrolase n=1 Tax=Nocardioides speluncae TaxID=2670337 RepID=UPI000D687165|nr:alpha/beta hydrolase [Nocardioides speluncae]